MKKVRIAALFLLILMASHVLTPVAAAHPLGNFTINHYAGLHVQPQAIVIDYNLDMAEIPTFQEIAALDANGNGQADAQETTPYRLAQCQRLQPQLALRLDGRPALLRMESSAIEFPPGAGGLPTLRLNCVYRAAMPMITEPVQVEFNNNAYAERLGWREIVVTSAGVLLQGELAAVSHSRSQRLSAYPDDLLTNPLDQREITFNVAQDKPFDAAQDKPFDAAQDKPFDAAQDKPFDAAQDKPFDAAQDRPFDAAQDRPFDAAQDRPFDAAQDRPFDAAQDKPFDAAQDKPSNPSTLLRADPAPFDRNDGFTKLITLEQLGPKSLLLALAIAFGWGATHALTPGHGKTIVAAYLVGSRGTSRHAFFLGLTTTITHTVGVFALGFLTLLASHFILPEQLYPWLGVVSGSMVVVLGLSVFSARSRQFFRPDDHDQHHHHHHLHDHDHSHVHPHAHDHDHDHAHGHAHHHLPPGANGSPVTWRSLLALGISGGLVPCPSALVVMLSAIALGRIGLGLVLIVAFSLGLAGVLTAIGLLWVHAGRLIGRLPLAGPLVRVVPALSALFIVLAGVAMTWQALAQTGVLPADMAVVTMMLNNGP